MGRRSILWHVNLNKSSKNTSGPAAKAGYAYTIIDGEKELLANLKGSWKTQRGSVRGRAMRSWRIRNLKDTEPAEQGHGVWKGEDAEAEAAPWWGINGENLYFELLNTEHWVGESIPGEPPGEAGGQL